MLLRHKTSNGFIDWSINLRGRCSRVIQHVEHDYIRRAAPQMEPDAMFPTSYIPTTTAAVTRGGDFASITGPNFSSWYNPLEGTFGVEFQMLYSMNDTQRFILTGDGGPLQLLYIYGGEYGQYRELRWA